MRQKGMQKNVIIIDESLFMRTTIRLLLERKGCLIYEADEELKAVTMTVHKKPELILMSLGFAKQNKMKFVKVLKNIHKCPVIIYANSVTKEDVVQSFSASADDFLLKPLQQGERLGRYFFLNSTDIRKFYLNGAFIIEKKDPGDWEQETEPGLPVREGGNMRWDLKAV